MVRRWAILLLAVAAIFGAVAWRRVLRDEFALPPRLRVERVVEDLTGRAPDAGGRLGWVKPGQFNADGGYRQAILADPPASLRYRLHPPADAVLRFAVGVQGTGKRNKAAAGIRFAVSLDGREAFARVVNPAANRHDRHWFEEEVDLGAQADRDVELTLSTRRAGSNPELGGLAGWSDVRLVRGEWRERQTAGRQSPNVVILLVDTLRADRLGCYGAVPSPSPNLDRLAARALVFEHMVAQSSWTMPAVASLMTGLYPRDHRLEGWGAGALSNEIPTMAEYAAAAGITTVGVSANPLVSLRTNFARGFETFRDFGWDEKRRNWAPAADVDGPFFRWLERNRGHRFLAYLHYMEPHDPYTPPDGMRPAAPEGVRPKVAAGYLDGIAVEVGGPDKPPIPAVEVTHLRGLYDGEIRAWDAALGEVLATLSRFGLDDSTVVIVVADHGEEFQEHGRLKHGSHLYEETIHVPLVVAGPGIVPGRRGDLAQSIDLFPTVAALLGVTPPPGLPGHDLLSSATERPVFSETHHGIAPGGGDMHLLSVRTPGWKLIHTPALARFELYDLARDPGEHDDRFGTVPEGEHLVELLTAWERAAPPPPQVTSPDPALREKLRALGYVE
jgi:arylsulfatase A-like enzyme